jgi:outer membrane immunogenic protein
LFLRSEDYVVIKRFAVSLLFLSPAAALGSDLPDRSPAILRQPAPIAAPAVTDWSGFRVGAYGGAMIGDIRFSSPAAIGDSMLSITETKLHRMGPLTGFRAGYDLQSGRFVYGVEADLGVGAVRGSMETAGIVTKPPMAPAVVATQINVATFVQSRVHTFGAARARLGYAFDDLLVYGAGGYAAARYDARFSLQAIGAGASGTQSMITSREWSHGWTLGLGGDYALSRHVSMQLEYLYAQLSKRTAADNVSHSQNLFRAGLNYRF